jgi:D-glycero-D-manno-heptose 1,7-bisphosphate phosphatase
LEKQKIVILDRDGTLIENIDYLKDENLIRFLPNCIETLKFLNRLNYHLFVVTNQSGIGRGLISKEQYDRVTSKIRSEFLLNDVRIVDIKHCPHTPEDNCRCRKPKSALGSEIIEQYDVEISRSFVIGDSFSDIDFGKSIKFKTILINNHETYLNADYKLYNWLNVREFFESL